MFKEEKVDTIADCIIIQLYSAQTPVFKMFPFVIKQRTSKTLCTVTDFVIFPLLLYFAMNHF